jgi:hypothetical protein
MVQMKVNRGRRDRKYRGRFQVWKRGLKPGEEFGLTCKKHDLVICFRRNDLMHNRGQGLSRIALPRRVGYPKRMFQGPHLDRWGKSWNGQHLLLKKFA